MRSRSNSLGRRHGEQHVLASLAVWVMELHKETAARGDFVVEVGGAHNLWHELGPGRLEVQRAQADYNTRNQCKSPPRESTARLAHRVKGHGQRLAATDLPSMRQLQLQHIKDQSITIDRSTSAAELSSSSSNTQRRLFCQQTVLVAVAAGSCYFSYCRASAFLDCSERGDGLTDLRATRLRAAEAARKRTVNC